MLRIKELIWETDHKMGNIIKVSNFQQVGKVIEELTKKYGERVVSDIEKITRDNTKKLRTQIQKKTPKGISSPHLKNSWVLEIKKDEHGRIIGAVYSNNKNVAYYSGFLEFGTIKMDAQPFARPALQVIKPKYENEILKTLENFEI